MAKIRRAIVSVSDKRGLVELAQVLARHEVEILSTGGTARALGAAGVATTPIGSYTGFPEILDGRVKTLHPKIHGGLLGRPIEEHERQMREHGIERIDLVVVNLYPFRETVAKPGVKLEEAIENIDIGGPSMLRSSAKNYERVTVLVDPSDYDGVASEIEATGEVSRATRFRLAKKAFAHTAAYDGAIAAWLTTFPEEEGAREPFPEVLTVQWTRDRILRYGENPHQAAAFYVEQADEGKRPALGRAEVLQGKELSYNNLLDLDAALECVLELDESAVVIVKHTNPCGVGTGGTLLEAYRRALETDPVSAFGGIVALNRTVEADVARELSELFLECIIAPGFDGPARELLAKKKNLRLVATGDFTAADVRAATGGSPFLRTVSGGILVQSRDRSIVAAPAAKIVTRRQPTQDELAALDFTWRVGKHVKSNAIVFGRVRLEGAGAGAQTVGIGAGQMSRVDAAKVAVMKAKLPLEGTVVASDAFFPFRDGVDAIADAGATAIIQPGGSVRDEEVIAAADERGLAMLFTGMRHFRH